MARAEVDALVLQMSADVRRMEKAMQQMASTTDRRVGQVEARFNKMNSHIKQSGDRMAGDLTRTFAAIGVIASVRGLTDAADKWTNLRNQVSKFSDVVGPTSEATERLKDLADDAGISVTSLGSTFAASARAAKTLGASGASVYAFNEAVAKGSAIANNGVAAVNGALIQLGQAISSPRVELQEFNSVIEGTPRLAQAFADGVEGAEGSVAKLRQMIAKGEVSGATLFQGLVGQLPKLRKEFAESEATISRSVNRIGNAYLQYVGNADRAMGVSQLLSGFLNTVADNFQLLADAAIVAAGVMGGALALGAMIRFVSALKDMAVMARGARTAIDALKISASFFTGPVGAAMLAIGAALGVMALNAGNAGDAMERADEAITKLGAAQAAIKADTDALAEAQDRLTKAIEAGSQASANAAITDVEAIRKRIAANAALAQSEKVRLNQAKVAREQQFRENIRLTDTERQGVDLPILGLLADQTAPLDELMRRMQDTFRRSGMDSSIEGMRSEIAARSNKGALDQQFRTFFWILERFDKYQADIKSINEAIASIDSIASMDVSGDILMIPGTSADGGSAATKGVKGYRTELEKLRETLKALRSEQGADAALIQQGAMAYDSLQVNGQAAVDYAEKLAEAGEKLGELEKGASARAVERSRMAVQALIDLGNSDLKAAFEQIPSFSDILIGGDEALVRTKLGEMAKAAADAVASGVDKIGAEFEAAVRAVEAARAAAIASGVTDLAMFDRAIQDLLDGLDKDLEDRLESPMPYDLAQIQRDMEDIDVPEFVDEFESLRAGVRDGMRAGLREGIQTDNWGQALRNAVAESVLGGFNDAIDRAADLLTDVITGKNPIANQLFSWATGGMLKGPGRAAGGDTSPFTRHQVNENGQGEFLFMGKNPGKVLTAAQINGMVSGGKGKGGVNVVTNVTLNGSDDRLRQEFTQILNVRDRRIMSAVPATVNATLSDNRMQKRRL